MSMTRPDELIDERVRSPRARKHTLKRRRFKKSGEFDRLRRELLTQFQHSERIGGLQSRVEDIARQRLASDPNLIRQPHDAVCRELLGEIDRYPILERAVAEAPLLSEASFAETIRSSVQRILDENRTGSENCGEHGIE